MTVNDVIKKASNEIGTTEYPPGSNNVKYNTEFYGRAVHDGDRPNVTYPWCCVFVWWVFRQFMNTFPKTASCINLASWFKQEKRFFTDDPRPGDIVFFKFNTNSRWTNHVGIVVEVQGDSIITIEGNTSINSNDNGGAVMKRTRKSNIVGYGRPAYETQTQTQTQPVPKQKKNVFGIDVSSCQLSVDFEKVKGAGYDFVILRSTQKDYSADPKFEKYWKDATKAGMHIAGVYKYCYAMTPAAAKNEALGVLKLLNGRKCDIWLDMEYNGQILLGKEKIAQIITAFLTTCVNAGYDVGIYCNLNWYNNYIKDDIKKICRFWIARYGKNTGQMDVIYKPNVGEVMWQYSSKGKVNGISGNVDVDVMWI